MHGELDDNDSVAARGTSAEVPEWPLSCQCFDKAAAMARHNSSVNERLLRKNDRALFVNCDNHSLNVFELHSAEAER